MHRKSTEENYRNTPFGVAHRCVRSRSFGIVLLVTLSLAIFWPIVCAPESTLITGRTGCGTVPLFNLWSLWWNADRCLDGFQNYWDAPIFYPESGTFCFSEPQPATLIVAPVIWITGSRVLASNCYLLFSQILNSVFAGVLLRKSGFGSLESLAGAAAVGLLPIVHAQAEAVQLVPVWGILWTWSATLRAARAPSVYRGAEVGTAVGISWWLCAHHGLFLTTLLTGTAAVLVSRSTFKKLVPAVIVALAVATLMVLPVALPIQRASHEHRFERSSGTVTALSARATDYLAAPGRTLIPSNARQIRPGWKLGIGWGQFALAIAGIMFGITRRRRRRSTLFFAATAIMAFLLSLGPHLAIGDWQPWSTIASVVPGFGQVRSVFRFAFFVQLSLILLAVTGVHGVDCLLRLMPHKSAPPLLSVLGRRTIRRCVVAGLTLLVAFEVIPKTHQVAGTPDVTKNLEWINFVRDNTPPGKSIACLPFAPGNTVAEFDLTARWMYYGTWHGVPLVNGYSGFFPKSYFALRERVGTSFPELDGLRALLASRVEFVVAIRSLVPETPLEDRLRFNEIQLDRVLECSNGTVVFRLSEPEN
jgi:hypothetical protein